MTGGETRPSPPSFTVQEIVETMKAAGVLEELKAKAVQQLHENRSREKMERMATRLVQRRNLVRQIYEEKKLLHNNPAAIFQSLHRDLSQRLHNDPGLAMFIDHSIDRVLVTGSSTNANNTGIKHIIHKTIQETVSKLLSAPAEPQSNSSQNIVDKTDQEQLVESTAIQPEEKQMDKEAALKKIGMQPHKSHEVNKNTVVERDINKDTRSEKVAVQEGTTETRLTEKAEMAEDFTRSTDAAGEDVETINDSDEEERALQALFNEFGSSSDESEDMSNEEEGEGASKELPEPRREQESDSDSWSSDSSDEILFQMDLDQKSESNHAGEKRKLNNDSPPRKIQKTQ